MRHLNYTHLRYFWTVATEGSIAKASEVLHLTPQTISSQIKLLEDSMGSSLFSRSGRGLVLTETGHTVKQYADEIFALGMELSHRVHNQQSMMPTTFHVGVVNSIPKLIALRIIEPAFSLEEPVRVVCREGSLDQMIGELATHKLDLVISDRGLPPGSGAKAYTHALGESPVSLFAHKSIAGKYRRSFPRSLDGATMLLPVPETAIRRAIDDWCDKQQLRLNVVAEFEDSALLKAFGEAAVGVFPAPSAISAEVTSMYHSVHLGEMEGVKESFFAISPERKLKHPAVLRITEHSRNELLN